MSRVDIDVSDFREFFGRVERAARGDFKKEMEVFLEGLGNEFLRVIQEEIIRRKVMDSRLLLNSFEQGGADNIWEITDGGLTLEVGTGVNYASYVNDGHWTNPKGVKRRWVPGFWSGHRFVYDPSAKTGMLLKQKWVEGAHYWESGLRIIERIYPELLEKKLQEWMDRYFS